MENHFHRSPQNAANDFGLGFSEIGNRVVIGNYAFYKSDEFNLSATFFFKQREERLRFK
jgi:hypothetical protein